MTLQTREVNDTNETPDFYWCFETGSNETGDGSKENPWQTRAYAETQMPIGATCQCLGGHCKLILSEKVA